MRVVLDTNVLVSALIVKAGKPAQIMRHTSAFTLLLTDEILAETAEVLGRKHIRQRYPVTDADVNAYLRSLRAVGTVIKVEVQVDIITRDPEDNRVLALAQAGGADYIVSGDPHLTELGIYAGIPILTPAQFLDVLARREQPPSPEDSE